MGDGLILQKGRHSELLQDENGAYARLVAAQKLREVPDSKVKQDSIEDDSLTVDTDTEEAQEDMPLIRRETQRSLASQILEQRRKETQDHDAKDYSMYYLFKRMGTINKTEWRRYLLGSICAISELISCSALYFTDLLRPK